MITNFKILTVVFSCFFMINSCSTIPVRVSRLPLDIDKPVSGILYYLPKTVLKIEFKLNLLKECSAQIGDRECRVIKSLSLSDPVLSFHSVPDQAAGFVIEPASGFMVKSDFTAAFSEIGELVSAKAGSSDHSFDWLVWGIKTISSFVGMGAESGTPCTKGEKKDVPPTFWKLSSAISEFNGLIERVAANISPKKVPANSGAAANPDLVSKDMLANTIASSDYLMKLIDARSKLQSEYDILKSNLNSTVSFPVSCLVEIDSVGNYPVFDKSCLSFKKAFEQLELEYPKSESCPNLPELAINFELHPSLPSDHNSHATTMSPVPNAINGFYYRNPSWFDVYFMARVGQSVPIRAFAYKIPVPQRGLLTHFAVGEHDLRPGKRIEVELHSGLGSLKTVTLNGDPLTPESLNSFSDSTIGLAKSVNDVNLSKIKKQTDYLKAEKAYLDAKRDLEDLKK